MPELKLNKKFQNILNDFSANLQKIFREDLISLNLYGSAASGEFIDKHSNLNLLIVLKNTDLENLKKASALINKWKFRFIHPIFLSEEYIKASSHIFPIEFLDMKENYTVLFGKDALKDLAIDTKHLRFQCEQELRVKLISLKQLYLRNRERVALLNLLFRSFTSIMHILRNVLRIKGKQPAYLKHDILKDIATEFQIDRGPLEKILAAKNKRIKLSAKETEQLFINFAKDLEKIINAVDKL